MLCMYDVYGLRQWCIGNNLVVPRLGHHVVLKLCFFAFSKHCRSIAKHAFNTDDHSPYRVILVYTVYTYTLYPYLYACTLCTTYTYTYTIRKHTKQTHAYTPGDICMYIPQNYILSRSIGMRALPSPHHIHLVELPDCEDMQLIHPVHTYTHELVCVCL